MPAPTHYLDHAATTPMVPAAVDAVREAMTDVGNASSLHTSGRRARRRVEESREQLAAALGARPGEIVLTAGGTESDNLALKGLFWSRHAADPRRRRVLVSAVEHHAVLDPAAWLEAQAGARVEVLPVDTDGRLRVDALADALARGADDVALVSCMWANNEVGTLQPLDEVVAPRPRARHPGAQRRGACGGTRTGRLRRLGPRRAQRRRAQARWSGRRRCAAGATRPRPGAAAARRRSGARRALGHAGRARPARVRGGRGAGGRRAGAAGEAAARPACRPGRARTSGAARGRRQRTRWTKPTGCPAPRTSPSPAATATRC